MSEKISNLYAARIFAEHPIALWALDDNFDYISLLSESYKNLENWELENLEVFSNSIPENLPIKEEFSGIFTINSASAGLSGSATSLPINTINDLDPDKATISINAFVYDVEGFIESFDIGFIINGSASFSNFSNIEIKNWKKIFYTLKVPKENVDLYPFIKVYYKDPQVESGGQFNFAINAISVGQWSELFHYENTGVTSEPIDNQDILSIIEGKTSLPTLDISAVIADSYGIADPLNGYYILEKNRMLSTNNRLPMTFGATNITNIKYPLYGNIPSLVFPGVGFLNEGGRYNELTAEFWLRCYTNVRTPLKIFGPLSSDDGLYIEKEFITIKIGLYAQSYFVGKWYRPMLIDFRYSPENVSLLINGDLVIELSIDQNKINFPDLTKNYLGFFGNENIYPFDLDAFAIYPYLVQEQVAKRRFVYAKGVDSADNIASNFKGDSFTPEFPFAKYTKTLNYPDMTDWNAGFFLNANSTSRFLSLPEYLEPEIIFDQQVEINAFLLDNYEIQGSDYPFIKLKPNSNYDNIVSSIYFRSLNILNEPVKSIFGIFRAPENLGAEKEVLMFFTNNFNNNTFSVKLSQEGLEYFYNDILIYSIEIEENNIFFAGFDLDIVSVKHKSILKNFFSNPQNLSLSLGGDQKSVFSGNIYKINFNDRFFTDKDIKQYIESNGFINSSIEPDFLIGYIGNYTYYPQILSENLFLDIGSSGYWEDSVPLSYFGKFVKDRLGNSYYDLDLIQFNLETPSPLTLKKDEYYVLDGGLFSTLDFELYFNSGNPTTEDFLLIFDGGNPFTTEFIEFLTKEELDIAYGNFSSPDYTVKTYMTIQEKNEVGNTPYSQYVNTRRIGADRVLDFDNVFNFRNTKYEITDNTIIFPPKEQVNFEDYYITTHIELQTKGIKKNPVKLKRMSFSSLAYDESTFYSINSLSGYKMFPFSRSENTYIFKEKNPFIFYKDTSSYMYKTADSGVSVLPYESNAPTRGLTVPINQQIAEEYLLGGVQVWGFYNKDERIKETIKIGMISTASKKYDIVLIPEENNLRGRIEIFDSNTQNRSKGIVFYQNGNIVDNPHLEPLSWNSFIFTFDESLILNGRVGQFEIYEGMLVNNIAFYRKATDILGTTLTDKNWQEVRSESVWGTWLEQNPKTEDIYSWDQVNDKFIIETFSVDGKAIYETTFGLSTAILKDNSKILLESDGVKIITGTVWDQFADRPV
jgi:hypothetical protein